MAEAIALPLRGDPDVKKLLDLLSAPGYQSQRGEYESLLDYVDTITAQYNTILSELDALKEKVSKITDRKNPLAVMVENLENLADSVGTKLRNLKDGIISFTKNALDAVKEKGLSALGAVFGALHVKDGLQAMSNGLAKSVEALDKAVARVDSLEQHKREKTITRNGNEEIPPPVEQADSSLSELLAGTRLDFENLSQAELEDVYEHLLEIGINYDLTAGENVCLQSLMNEVDDMLPDSAPYNPELEMETDQGVEM